MSFFLTFEGIEGCGKSTQASRIAEHLRELGREVVLTREPGGTDVTKRIRALLADPNSPLDSKAELFLFFADRAQHVSEVILPALARGAVVVCDRYSDSTMAYQSYGRGHDLDLLTTWNDWASDATVPDLTLWIDCDVEVGLTRARGGTGGHGDRFEAEPLAFHRKIRSGFADIARRHPDRVHRIDGAGSEDEVGAAVRSVVMEHLR